MAVKKTRPSFAAFLARLRSLLLPLARMGQAEQLELG